MKLRGTIDDAVNAIQDAHDFVALENPKLFALRQHSNRGAIVDALNPLFGSVEDSVANQVRHVLEAMRSARKPTERVKRIRARLRAAI